ncbi:siderophore-interacting protein [Auraticoccus monumenti]|uniref:NADPH-dependent ferric siderophore reductase, contains FAD-binding and SIP domains n=1 Tax=Auraticoccus monumenti TaxID=675864 RepID=A0A1G6YKI6_9ACTN|nr:siderophore-interacting protein [Auraticoccus monumenti]SDD90791.1 NADPH-dependent ferric siderophore reductase, contains FAD-binding and SIP domains [Auraticoccus monumenti]
MPADRPARPQRAVATLTVQSTEQLAPHLVRVVLGGEEIELLRHNGHTDKYVKLHFTPVPEEPSVTRTYTVRHWDTTAGTITLDFITHGDAGLAAPWALSARPGDTLSMVGAGGAWSPSPEADWYLLVGDDTAIPAISSAVEALPADARGEVVIEVDSPADEVAPTPPPGVRLTWLHRRGVEAGAVSLLPAAVTALDWPAAGTPVDVFAHGEREAMKQLRDVFFTQRALPRSAVSLSGYWAYGRTEDRFQAEKQEPIGQILPPE